jgi:aromatic ring-opening dioxygenase LigB subunit
MNTSLYQLSAEYQMAFAELMEIPDLPAEVIRDTLEGLAGDLETKSINVAAYFLSLDAQAAAIKEAEAKMAARRKAIEAKSARLKDYLKQNMQACEIQKISCPEFEISLRKNPPSVIIDDESLIPLEFIEIRETRHIDKAAIKAVKGCAGAHIEQGFSLVIR